MLKRITVWLDASTLAKLRKIAKTKERTMGWLLRKAAEEYAARESV